MLTRIRGHYLWAAPLKPDSIIVDAGAHRGEFSAEIIQRFGSRCHLIEANPDLAAKLSVPGAEIISAALAARDGRATFQFNANPESGTIMAKGATPITGSAGVSPASFLSTGRQDAGAPRQETVETISLPTLMQRFQLDHIDLLKLDIEGAEFDLVDQTPDDVWRRVGQITVEFHDFQKHFAGRGLFERARARLEQLGFVCCLMSFRTHGDVLFLNRERLRLNGMQTAYARHVARYPAKLKAICS
jgi:FkbM family methyltransferase